MTEFKITQANKGKIQFLFSNPHVLKDREEFNGIKKSDIESLKASLQRSYGDNWFAMFLALKPKTLNERIG